MGGEAHGHLKAWDKATGCPNKGSGALQDTAPRLFPGAPSFPAGRQPEELAGTEGGGWTQLLPHSPPNDHHSTNRGRNDPLTVAH